MKKILAFIVLVILVIIMIVLSYNFYSNNSRNSTKNKLKTSLKVTKNKTKEVVDNVTDTVTNKTNEKSTSNSDVDNTVDETDITVEEDSNVPDTASYDDSDYVAIDHYTVSVDKSTMKVGETSNIYVKVYPVNASEREVSFISSDESIIKVDSFGKMKALSKGEVTITIKVKNTNDYSFKVNVK